MYNCGLIDLEGMAKTFYSPGTRPSPGNLPPHPERSVQSLAPFYPISSSRMYLTQMKPFMPSNRQGLSLVRFRVLFTTEPTNSHTATQRRHPTPSGTGGVHGRFLHSFYKTYLLTHGVAP